MAKMKTKQNAVWAVVMLACLAVSGCANFSTVQTDRRFDESGNVTTEVTTKAKATTFFASKSSLANWKASQTEKTQGAEVGTLEQEASGTGKEMGEILGYALKAYTGAATP